MRPTPGSAREVGLRLGDRRVAHPREVQWIADRLEHGLDAHRLDLRDPARPDRLLDLLHRARRAPPPTPRSGRAGAGRRRRGCGRWSTARARSAPARRPGRRAAPSRGSRTSRAGARAPRARGWLGVGARGSARGKYRPRADGPGHRAPRHAAAISPCSGAAPRAASRPCSTCTACRRAPTTGSASSQRTGGLAPDLPGFGRSGKRGDGDFTMPGYDRFVEAFLDHAEVERVRLVVHDWGAVGLLWAQRFPERVERLVVINAVPLLPGYRWHRVARLWRMRGVGEVAIGLSTRWAWRRALPPAGGRRVLAALRPGHPARDPAALPREPGGRARARRPGSRAHRLPGARRVGRPRSLPAPRRSPTPTRTRSAATPRSCTSTRPGTGPGSTGRMPSIASPRSWTPRADPGVGAGRRRRGGLPRAGAAERGPRGAVLPRRPRPRAVGQRLVRRPSHARLQRALPAAGRRCSARGSSGR